LLKKFSTFVKKRKMEVLNPNISKSQVFLYLRKMKKTERINLFKEFDEDFYTYLYSTKINRLLEDEYNERLLKSEDDIKHNRVKNQEEFELEVEQWLKN
jgi:hypothetical protein